MVCGFTYLGMPVSAPTKLKTVTKFRSNPFRR